MMMSATFRLASFSQLRTVSALHSQRQLHNIFTPNYVERKDPNRQNSLREYSISPTPDLVTPATHITQNNVKEILSKYDTILLDCDGVLWDCDHFTKFQGIPNAIDKLRKLNKSLKFVTNNSLHTRTAFVNKFRNFGGFDAETDDVFSVAYAAVVYLKNIVKITGKCYMIGTKGMKEELESAEIDYLGFGPDHQRVSIRPEDILALDFDPEVQAVLVGFDEHFNYQKLTKACSYLLNPSCHYVATNDLEKWIQLSKRWRQPLTGSIIPAISAACGRQPLVIGKPYDHLMRCIQAEIPEINLGRTLMVGDSIKTDVGFAINSGIDSLLVLSGATKKHVLRKQEASGVNVPTYVIDSFAQFGQYL